MHLNYVIVLTRLETTTKAQNNPNGVKKSVNTAVLLVQMWITAANTALKAAHNISIINISISTYAYRLLQYVITYNVFR